MASPDHLTWRNEAFRSRLAGFNADGAYYLVAEIEAMWAEVGAPDYQRDVPRLSPAADSEHTTAPEQQWWRRARMWILTARRVLFPSSPIFDPPEPQAVDWLYEDTEWVYEDAHDNLAEAFEWQEWHQYRNELRSRVRDVFSTITPEPHLPYSTDANENIVYRSELEVAPAVSLLSRMFVSAFDAAPTAAANFAGRLKTSSS